MSTIKTKAVMIMRLPAWLACLVILATAGCASTPQRRIRTEREQFDAWPKEVQANIREGQIDVGYSREMVRMALGRPHRRHHRTNAETTEEVWVYTATRPRLSFGLGGGTGGLGAGVGIGTGGQSEARMRVIFREEEVYAIERLHRN